MADEKVVFSHTIEALLFRGIGEAKLTPTLKDGIRAAGIDLSRKLNPAYPRDVWVAALKRCAQEVHRELPLDEAYRALGRSLVQGYDQTIVGKAVIAMTRLLGPKRSLARMTHNFRSGNNYSETKITEKANGVFELWVNEVNGNPGYLRGILEQVLTFAGAQELSVEPRDFDGHACTFVIRWKT